jgi:hypothetical protein
MGRAEASHADMFISPGRAFVFVHIPKTGGTSMMLALEARAMADDILIGDTPKAQRRKHRLKRFDAPGRLWKHSRLSDIDRMTDFPDPLFVFTLVRNPWDRIASLYHWARMQSFDHPMIHASKALGFDAFLAQENIQTSLRGDTAAGYVTDRSGVLRCDAFVRLEYLQADLAPVETHLGFPIRMPHVNTSERPPADALYSPRTRDLVAEICAEDIARFGYGFPG